MDKKTIIVLISCFLGIFAWQQFVLHTWPPRKITPKQVIGTNTAPTEVSQATSAQGSSSTNTPTWTPQKPGETGASIVATPEVREPEKIVQLQNKLISMEFTTYGAGVKSASFLAHKIKEKSGDIPVKLNLAVPSPHGDIPAFSFITGGIPTGNESYKVKAAEEQIVFEGRSGPFALKKTFSFETQDPYRLHLQVEVTNTSAHIVQLSRSALNMGRIHKIADHESTLLLGLDYYVVDSIKRKKFDKLQKQPFDDQRPITWAALKNQYFTIVAEPSEKSNGISGNVASKVKTKEDVFGSLSFPDKVLAPNESMTVEYQLYIGPKEYKRLKNAGHEKEDIMEFSVFMGLSIAPFRYIAEILLIVLVWAYGLVKNYGLAIVLVTILIKLLFWYPTGRATMSMKKMQLLQPKMEELRKKYDKDTTKLNSEMIKLYKDYKINPLNGCLPLLLQIPVFFAFYSILQSSVELRGAEFLWVNDLSKPDTVMHLFGLPINPLPLIMGATMVWQQKITPTSMDPIQAKIMMFLPLVFLFICYNFSSGLALYWTVQNLLSILQTWINLKRSPATLELATPKIKR